MHTQWAHMGSDFDTTWALVGKNLLTTTSLAQRIAAQDGIGYITKVMAQTGQQSGIAAAVQPERFAPYASDGRPLESMLYGAVTTAKTAISNGQTVTQALATGRRWLDMAVLTTVSDANRQACAAAIIVRPDVAGWVRMVQKPSSPRCLYLGTLWYPWHAKFERHPFDMCRYIPASEAIGAQWLTESPEVDIAANAMTNLHSSSIDGQVTVDDILTIAGGDREAVIALLASNAFTS